MPDISKITTPDGTSWDVKDLKARGVELTQAEYDALPSSKLTDGVDYYITDAQAGSPLATEIAMSTSDNTSVAEKINDLNEVTSGSLTLDATYIRTAEINRWVKKGNIVEFWLTATVNTPWTINNIVASGLPTPLGSGRILGLNTSSNVPLRFNIGTNGLLSNAYSATAPSSNHIIEVHGTYIAGG